ncbi:hypothetical protein EVAR_98333_1 [Eumeta japonica]|uniref:Uncharacterized protein n=1 Tax=Eumeta variegata TaxID=151549 RepID=A0A4C1X9I4_EUMVA|nr:hypothetical protein EVAR_98333_1 [Eumeta japonica]
MTGFDARHLNLTKRKGSSRAGGRGRRGPAARRVEAARFTIVNIANIKLIGLASAARRRAARRAVALVLGAFCASSIVSYPSTTSMNDFHTSIFHLIITFSNIRFKSDRTVGRVWPAAVRRGVGPVCTVGLLQ